MLCILCGAVSRSARVEASLSSQQRLSEVPSSSAQAATTADHFIVPNRWPQNGTGNVLPGSAPQPLPRNPRTNIASDWFQTMQEHHPISFTDDTPKRETYYGESHLVGSAPTKQFIHYSHSQSPEPVSLKVNLTLWQPRFNYSRRARITHTSKTSEAAILGD